MKEKASAPPIRVTPRKLDVDFPQEIARYWCNNSPFMTHMLNTYTLLVPDNESYYIRQMNRCMGEIKNDEQKNELLRFFRQEGQHGISHKIFWQNLEAQGLKYKGFVSGVGWFLYRFLEPILPRSVHLANIACIEHVNAYLGNFYLSRNLLENTDERMRLLFEWHFAEEIEHKAVAFDLYQTLAGSYILRMIGALLVLPLFYLLNLLGTFYLLAQDGKLFARSTWLDFGRLLFKQGALLHTVRHIGRYMKPGFHPWQTRDYKLAADFFQRDDSLSSIHPLASAASNLEAKDTASAQPV